MGKRTVVVFDFDGTLTRKDSFLEFIKFSRGKMNYYIGMIICSPLIIAYILHLYPNYKAKQFVFSYFFKGMSYESFKLLGQKFQARIEKIINPARLKSLEAYHHSGCKIIVISASVTEWIAPWCQMHYVDDVIGTIVEVSSDGRLTGRFKSKNCYGKEKVCRLMAIETNRDTYYLIAYGDSSGDSDLLNYADEAHFVRDHR